MKRLAPKYVIIHFFSVDGTPNKMDSSGPTNLVFDMKKCIRINLLFFSLSYKRLVLLSWSAKDVGRSYVLFCTIKYCKITATLHGGEDDFARTCMCIATHCIVPFLVTFHYGHTKWLGIH